MKLWTRSSNICIFSALFLCLKFNRKIPPIFTFGSIPNSGLCPLFGRANLDSFITNTCCPLHVRTMSKTKLQFLILHRSEIALLEPGRRACLFLCINCYNILVNVSPRCVKFIFVTSLWLDITLSIRIKYRSLFWFCLMSNANNILLLIQRGMKIEHWFS